MTINEEQVGYPELEVISYSNLGKADIDLLISLMGEYGEKLISLCEKIEDNKQKYSLGEFFLPRLGGSIALITWSIFSLQAYPYFVILGILIFAIFTIYVAVSANHIRKKIKISEREAKKMSSRLEKIIRIASQIQEHFSTNRRRSASITFEIADIKFIPLVISEVELDLRLADAESALEYYQEIIGK
jgi:uncharacterized membrane protein YciS (DUF1049 family)